MQPPDPGPAAAAACEALAAALPQQVDGQRGRDTDPESPYTAAWGTPPITLTCGVDRPPQLTATSELATVDGIADWLPIPLTNGYRFVTTGRAASVQVDVPSAYAPEINAIVDLAAPIKDTVPVSEDPASSPAPS